MMLVTIRRAGGAVLERGSLGWAQDAQHAVLPWDVDFAVGSPSRLVGCHVETGEEPNEHSLASRRWAA